MHPPYNASVFDWVIGNHAVRAFSMGEKEQAPWSGGLGEGRESELDSEPNDPGQPPLKPALRSLHDVGDDRQVLRRVRKADPASRIRCSAKDGEQLADRKCFGLHADIIPDGRLAILPKEVPAATYFWGSRSVRSSWIGSRE